MVGAGESFLVAKISLTKDTVTISPSVHTWVTPWFTPGLTDSPGDSEGAADAVPPAAREDQPPHPASEQGERMSRSTDQTKPMVP